MAPLNEDHDDEDDSTLFDVKYRLVTKTLYHAHILRSNVFNISIQLWFINNFYVVSCFYHHVPLFLIRAMNLMITLFCKNKGKDEALPIGNQPLLF